MFRRSRRIASAEPDVELGLSPPDAPVATTSAAVPEVSVVGDDGRLSSELVSRACPDVAPSDVKHGSSAPSVVRRTPSPSVPSGSRLSVPVRSSLSGLVNVPVVDWSFCRLREAIADCDLPSEVAIRSVDLGQTSLADRPSPTSRIPSVTCPSVPIRSPSGLACVPVVDLSPRRLREAIADNDLPEDLGQTSLEERPNCEEQGLDGSQPVHLNTDRSQEQGLEESQAVRLNRDSSYEQGLDGSQPVRLNTDRSQGQELEESQDVRHNTDSIQEQGLDGSQVVRHNTTALVERPSCEESLVFYDERRQRCQVLHRTDSPNTFTCHMTNSDRLESATDVEFVSANYEPSARPVSPATEFQHSRRSSNSSRRSILRAETPSTAVDADDVCTAEDTSSRASRRISFSAQEKIRFIQAREDTVPACQTAETTPATVVAETATTSSATIGIPIEAEQITTVGSSVTAEPTAAICIPSTSTATAPVVTPPTVDPLLLRRIQLGEMEWGCYELPTSPPVSYRKTGERVEPPPLEDVCTCCWYFPWKSKRMQEPKKKKKAGRPSSPRPRRRSHPFVGRTSRSPSR